MADVKHILQPEDLALHMPALLEAGALAAHIETTGRDPRSDKTRLLLLAAENIDETLVVDCFSFLPQGLAILREIFQTRTVKVFHDAKTSLQFLTALDLHPPVLFDTGLAARLLHMPGKQTDFTLDGLRARYLREESPLPQASAEPDDWSGALDEAQLRAAAMRTQYLLRLRRTMIPHIRQNGLVKVAQIEFQCVRALAHMEYHGIHLEENGWRSLLAATQGARRDALDALHPFLDGPVHVQGALWGEDEALGANFDSPCFVLDLLKRNGIPVEATSKLDLYPYRSHPLVAALSDYRRASKSLSSFLRPYLPMIHPRTGRLHPRYEQLAASSGRMSCAGPNIQQIPREAAFRECFSAPPGRRLILADYSQIELRVVAQISRDRRMLAAYRAGEDLHLLTASYLSGKPMQLVSKQERQEYKAVNLGLIYGMGAQGLQLTAQLTYGVDMPMEDAERFRRRFFETYEGIAGWHRKIRDQRVREGRTLSGRRLAFAERAGLPERSNLPVQGTSADIIKRALGLLVERIEGNDARIVTAVHDEILLECGESDSSQMAEVLKDAMEDAANEILPLVPTPVETVISGSWAEK